MGFGKETSSFRPFSSHRESQCEPQSLKSADISNIRANESLLCIRTNIYIISIIIFMTQMAPTINISTFLELYHSHCESQCEGQKPK